MVLQLLFPSITFIWPNNSTSDLQYVNHKKYEQITVLPKLYHRWKLSWDESWDHFYQKLDLIESSTLFLVFFFICFICIRFLFSLFIVFVFIKTFYCIWGFNFTSADFEKNIHFLR